MPKIVKLSDLDEKEREKLLRQTQLEIEERKKKIQNEKTGTSDTKKENSTQNIKNSRLQRNNSNEGKKNNTKNTLPTAKDIREKRNTDKDNSWQKKDNINRNNIKEKEEENKAWLKKDKPENKQSSNKENDKSNDIVSNVTSGIIDFGINTGLTLQTAGQAVAEALPLTWQWANRTAKNIEKDSSNSKTQEFLIKNYELNDMLAQGSTAYDNINKEKQKALDDLVNHGTGLEKLSSEQKENLKAEIQEILSKNENISMNNSDADIRGNQLDEISKAIEKYMGLDYYDKTVDDTQKAVDYIEEEKKKNVENATSELGQKTVNVLGNGLGSVATSAIPVIGGATLFASSSQQYYNEAKQRGMSDDKANAFGNIMGFVEAGTEGINIKNIKGVWNAFKTLGDSGTKEIIETAVKKGASQETLDLLENLGKSNLKTVLREQAQSSIENYAQEYITEYIQEGVAGAIDNKAQWDGILQRANEAGIAGALTALIPGMAGIVNVGNGRTQISNDQVNSFIIDLSNNNVTEQQIDLLSNELAKTSTTSKEEIKEGLQAVAEAYKEINGKRNSQITEQVNDTLPTANEENSYSNRLKQTATEEINNSNISTEEKAQMLEALESLNRITNEDVQAIRETINTTSELETNYQVKQQENKTIQNVEQVKKDSENFAKQIEEIKNGTFPQKDMITLGSTPQVLKDIGLPDLPITMTQKHLDTIMNESGKYKNANYHGLGEDIVKQLPEAINNPLDVVESNTQDDSIVLTTYLADKQDRTIIASIKIDGTGRVNDIMIDTNVMTSAYGRNNYEKFMENNLKNGKLLYDIDRGVIKKVTGARLQLPRASNSNIIEDNNDISINNSITQSTKNVKNDSTINNNSMQNTKNNTKNKTLNPSEIANMNKETASTTPKLEKKNYERGNKQSSFVANILTDSQFLNKDLRQEMGKEDSIKYYKGITNAETLEKAYDSLKKGGEKETLNWFSKNEKNTTAEDVIKGWILLKQYQDAGDYQSAVEVAKKMRQMGTNAGQAVQAYNILSRLTPEGMFYYAQSELNEAYNKMVEGKSKAWIDSNQDKFNLTPEETQTILDTMKEVSNMEDGREKTVKLAEIQKLVSNKIPPTKGQSIRAWMRISMLFNPKTQVRNVVGNAVILPVNSTSDIFAGAMDKLISKKTGIRTTGVTIEGIKGYAKGFGKGLFESYDDFRKGINTRDIKGNRFEIGDGKSFKDKGIGRAINSVDSMLSFMLDAGDRGFYEATFTNSINNQLVLNNTTEVTQDMIDIATNEALQRTWQDDNAYTQTVLTIRNALNGKIGKSKGIGYGLGDILIPFAKTPANLTKAIVDYSPVGLTKTLAVDARKFINSLNNGQYSSQSQHNFVQNLGKGMAGSLLYVLGYGLAKAGIATGEADDDKDVKNFMKNSLGISSYSINIGDKSFTYDWAQPIATPLAIMTNFVKYSKDNPDASILDKAIKSIDIGSEQLLQQSFMESINTVLNGSGTTLENLSQAILELPARAIPTLSKQIADMVDSTQRTSFEYDKPLKSAINSVTAKIPFASKALPVSRDTLGNEIQKYGGNNNVWNVMFNPANTNKGQLSKAGEEIYNVYMQTGDTTIFPRTAPYYINNKGEKITMTATQRSEFQKVSGQYVENALKGLLNKKDYKNLSDEKKASIINEIVSDSYAKAKYDILKLDSKEYTKLRNVLKTVSTSSYYDYKQKTDGMKKDSEKVSVLTKSKYTNKEKTTLYENYILDSTNTTYPLVKKFFTENGLNINNYLNYTLQDFESDKKDDGTVNGKSISGSRKKKVYNYINNMDITYSQKLLLLGTQYKLNNTERTTLANYINSSQLTYKEKLSLYGKVKGFKVYKNGKVSW